jgi:hypothetical protein
VTITEDRDPVADKLKSMPPPDVRGDFVARVNARIDERGGWFGVADFRLWTLRLAPAAAALALVGVFWSTPAASSSTETAAAAAPAFSPSSSSDWQQDVSGDALLDAALSPAGGGNVR